MSTVKEALESKDPKDVKKARGIVKGQVTISVDAIKKILDPDKDGKLEYTKINSSEVNFKVSKLKSNFKNFSELHDRYQWLRTEDDDDTKAGSTVQEEANYFEDVEARYFETLADTENYERWQDLQARNESLKEAKVEFGVVQSIASSLVESKDEDAFLTAPTVMSDLKEKLASLVKSCNEVKIILVLQKATPEELKEVDCTEERSITAELVNKLEYAIKKHKNEARLATGIIDRRSLSSTSGDILKLKKLDSPKFSGLSRDFAKFKRDFNTIVAVAGRPEVEIGACLKAAIPRKW